MAEKHTVYPVYHGPYVQHTPGVPAIPHEGLSKKEADELVATGAFTYDKPLPEEPASKPTTPPEGGVSDSSEEVA